ncbi:MAG TPA: SCP2 sterol-binding domain-containing protein, partial [Solirubrobacteraceae bacterium]|nr:SCP2 sterol-binding domain-containing protein [Solirubrobacteraceae bacterium]
PDVSTWHLTVNNGSSTVAEGEAPKPDLRLQVSYQDWVDVIGERTDPVRLAVRGRLRPKGNPLALRKLAKVFPQS